MITPHTYNKISQGITEETAKHAARTQPLFSNLDNEQDNSERPEWDWIKRK